MYYCRVVYVLLYIPMKTEVGGSMDPQDPPLDPPLRWLGLCVYNITYMYMLHADDGCGEQRQPMRKQNSSCM